MACKHNQNNMALLMLPKVQVYENFIRIDRLMCSATFLDIIHHEWNENTSWSNGSDIKK